MSTHRRARRHRHRSESSRTLTLRNGDALRKQRLRTPMTRCFHGKRRYFTRADAELVLGSIDTRDPRRREVRCYQCPACHGWHLTSQTVEQYSASRAETSPVRAPIKLDVPVSSSPVPTPAQLAARLGVRPITPPAPRPSPATARLRRLFDRVRRQLTERRRH